MISLEHSCVAFSLISHYPTDNILDERRQISKYYSHLISLFTNYQIICLAKILYIEGERQMRMKLFKYTKNIESKKYMEVSRYIK